MFRVTVHRQALGDSLPRRGAPVSKKRSHLRQTEDDLSDLSTVGHLVLRFPLWEVAPGLHTYYNSPTQETCASVE